MKLTKDMMNTEMRVSSLRTRSHVGTFFCDTYALIEIIRGNNNYNIYTNFILITSELNLMELYYSLFRDYGKPLAEKYFNQWEISAIRIPTSLIKTAMELKYIHNKEKLSYIDCMGYVYAMENGVPFLTGDSKFKNKDGVEFVK